MFLTTQIIFTISITQLQETNVDMLLILVIAFQAEGNCEITKGFQRK